MKNITKLFIDIGPLAVFFIFYTRSDLKSAILPFMVATVIAVLISYILEKKIPIMPTAGAFIILVFGSLSIYFEKIMITTASGGIRETLNEKNSFICLPAIAPKATGV